MINGDPISWKSRRQDHVSLSTSEAEFATASQAAQKVAYLRETLRDFKYSQSTATDIFEDNLSCIDMSENPVHRKFFDTLISVDILFVNQSKPALLNLSPFTHTKW